MIPVNQFILGSSDPLLYPSEKMTNSIDELKLMRFVNAIKKYYLMMLSLVMFMLQLMLNTMIMLNYLKNGLVVI